MELQAIIFDKDGVLIDSELGKMKAMKQAIASLGYKNVKGFKDWFLSRIGVGGLESCQTCVDIFGLEMLDPRTLYDKTEAVRRDMLDSEPSPIIKNNIRFLKYVHKKGFKIGVSSSDFPDNIKRQMEQAGILDYIDAITSGEKHSGEVTREKPDPDVYLVTANKLKVDPGYCIGIEDTTPGVQAVKAAGMYCIGYRNPNSGNQDLSKADRVTDDLSTIKVEDLFSLFE